MELNIYAAKVMQENGNVKVEFEEMFATPKTEQSEIYVM
jgi:hypothetical protein